jgi:hypothetical protein
MTDYILNESGILVPQIKDLHILIDDGGDSEIDFVGYTCILLDEYAYRDVERKVREFCSKYKIISLHARELKFEDRELADMNEYEALYRELFEFTIYELRRANYQRMLSFLTSEKTVSDVFSAQNDSFEKSKKLPHGAILSEKYRRLYSHITFPTFELLKRIGKVDDDMRFYIHIDRKENFQILAEEIVSLEGNIGASLGPVRKAIIAIFNSYKNLVIDMQARVDGIHIADTTSSPIIGVVDAFSNFSYNFAKVVIQGSKNSTETQKRKYRVFCEVVTTMSGEDTSHLARLEENIKKGFSFDGKKIIPITEKLVSTFEIIHAK